MAVTMINPTLTDEQAAATFAPVIDYVNSINGTDGILVTANGFVPGGSYLYLQGKRTFTHLIYLARD